MAVKEIGKVAYYRGYSEEYFSSVREEKSERDGESQSKFSFFGQNSLEVFFSALGRQWSASMLVRVQLGTLLSLVI